MKLENKLLRALGEVIASRRHELGISQLELASRAGINRTYIGDLERGARNIAILNIVKLSDALATTPSELLSAAEHTFEGDIQR
jgi:transcriptional regulator with XRE-family HTH domain